MFLKAAAAAAAAAAPAAAAAAAVAAGSYELGKNLFTFLSATEENEENEPKKVSIVNLQNF